MNGPASTTGIPTLEQFTAEARTWLDANAERIADDRGDTFVWGRGEFDVSVFHALTFEQERALIDEIVSWQRKKAERGYHAITQPVELGGLGLPASYARAFSALERDYRRPGNHEIFGVTTGLIAPTIRRFGTPEQQERFVAALLRTDILCCQLFSEPGAGSDLASLACRAERDGDEWVINGQKVWSSAAQFSQWGELIARTDPDEVKHRGLTAFMVPLDTPGIEIRPIKQMSGGSSFNEVFFTDVRIPDSLRLGAVGDGWNVALTTLSFERDHSSQGGGGGTASGGTFAKLLATAQALGRMDDPAVRRALVDVYIDSRVASFVNRRAADLRRAGSPPGPEGSLGKLLWTEGMRKMSDAVTTVLGPRLVADTGEWGTFAWSAHVLGAPGYRIAGGSDEVQRNIVGERVLGLPAEPRVDKDTPWRDARR